MKRFLIIFLTLLPLTFNQCSDVKFSEAPSSSSGQTTITPQGTKLYTVNHMFSSSQAKPVDVVWVVDNSGSMTTEAGHVRANLVNFVSSIASAVDLKFALISEIGTSGNAVDYPALGIPNMKINRSVSSTNALRLLSAAVCSAGMNSSLCSEPGGATIVGQLNGFLRQNSHKIVVVVTDDESDLTPEEFQQHFSAIYGMQSFTLYGWIGLGAASPCQARTGSRYMSLSQLSGGHVYNVCDVNWSAQFANLASTVVTLVNGTVALPAEILSGEILKVQINGVVISPTEYRVSSAGITFSSPIIQGLTTATLQIEYR